MSAWIDLCSVKKRLANERDKITYTEALKKALQKNTKKVHQPLQKRKHQQRKRPP